MFLLESKPAAKIFAFAGSQRLTRMRQAKREIVLCITLASFLSPGSVSITTKSIGDSEERPTFKIINRKQTVIRTRTNSKQSPSSIDPVIHPVSIYIRLYQVPGQSITVQINAKSCNAGITLQSNKEVQMPIHCVVVARPRAIIDIHTYIHTYI